MKDYRCDDRTMPLERMHSLATGLGDPHLATPAIHVAGTKGKGTTCLILEALLRSSGLRVGTYLSPHLENLRERVRVDGEPIREDQLVETLTEMLPELDRRHRLGPVEFPTFFEMMTALAMVQFRRSGVDVSIYEVGLGGRLDATNILAPGWTAITSIGLEHVDKLGHTLEAIAREKAGIVKPSTPLVLGEVAPEARSMILGIARSLGSPVLEVSAKRVQAVEIGGTTRLLVPPHDRPLEPHAIRGPGLRADLGLALTLHEEYLTARGGAPGIEVIERTLAGLRLPGRIERFEGPPITILDGAHTPESLDTLAVALEEMRLPRPRTAVVALASDKRIAACLERLAGLADRVIFTCADAVRGIPAGDLAVEMASRAPGLPVQQEDDPRQALRLARADGHPVIVTGSIYLAGALRAQLDGRAP